MLRYCVRVLNVPGGGAAVGDGAAEAGEGGAGAKPVVSGVFPVYFVLSIGYEEERACRAHYGNTSVPSMEASIICYNSVQDRKSSGGRLAAALVPRL